MLWSGQLLLNGETDKMKIPQALPIYPHGTKGVADEAHFEDNEIFYFGDDDDFQLSYDGTNLIIGTSTLPTGVFKLSSEGSISAYKSDGSSRYKRTRWLEAANVSPGASGATLTALNAVLSYNLDAANEFIYAGISICSDWDGTSDVTIKVCGYLPNAETANDLVRMSVRCDYAGNGDDANTTKTQTLDQDYDISSGNAQYTFHILTFTLDHDLAANVLEKGDKLFLKIWLDDVTTAPIVPAFNVTTVGISYSSIYPQVEA